MGSQISATFNTLKDTMAGSCAAAACHGSSCHIPLGSRYDAVQATIKVAGVEGAVVLVALTLGLGLYVLLGGRRTD